MKKALFHILAAVFCILLSAGCQEKADPYGTGKTYSRVAIFSGFAFNNLASDIMRNVNAMKASPLPMEDDSRVVVLFMHTTASSFDYSTPNPPCIIRVTGDWDGTAKLDTLFVFGEKDQLTNPETFRKGMQFIADKFPSDHYGLMVSSHGTGWLPEGYYDNPDEEEQPFWAASPLGKRDRQSETIQARRDLPMTKSFGCEAYYDSKGKTRTSELNLQQIPSAIPMHLDYLIFDACLMGCVETAWELRTCTDRIIFSQAEVLTSGFDLSTFTKRLLMSPIPDIDGFAEDYFRYYDEGKGGSKSATISAIDCTRMGNLAKVCSRLFDTYRSGIDGVDASKVQGYFRSGKHWFYDLEDILLKSGISASDQAALSAALGECVTYKNATPDFLGSFNINHHCGFSMCLPNKCSNSLKEFYKTLAWNETTLLVK